MRSSCLRALRYRTAKGLNRARCFERCNGKAAAPRSARHNGVQVVCINHASAVMGSFITFFPPAYASRAIIRAINLTVGHSRARFPPRRRDSRSPPMRARTHGRCHPREPARKRTSNAQNTELPVLLARGRKLRQFASLIVRRAFEKLIFRRTEFTLISKRGIRCFARPYISASHSAAGEFRAVLSPRRTRFSGNR